MWGQKEHSNTIKQEYLVLKNFRLCWCDVWIFRSFPINFILLAIFTITEGIILGMVSRPIHSKQLSKRHTYHKVSMKYDTDAVIIAAGITTIIVFSLTIFAFQVWTIDITYFYIQCLTGGLTYFYDLFFHSYDFSSPPSSLSLSPSLSSRLSNKTYSFCSKSGRGSFL